MSLPRDAINTRKWSLRLLNNKYYQAMIETKLWRNTYSFIFAVCSSLRKQTRNRRSIFYYENVNYVRYFASKITLSNESTNKFPFLISQVIQHGELINILIKRFIIFRKYLRINDSSFTIDNRKFVEVVMETNHFAQRYNELDLREGKEFRAMNSRWKYLSMTPRNMHTHFCSPQGDNILKVPTTMSTTTALYRQWHNAALNKPQWFSVVDRARDDTFIESN